MLFRMQFAHGSFLSHLTLRRRHVTQLQTFRPCSPGPLEEGGPRACERSRSMPAMVSRTHGCDGKTERDLGPTRPRKLFLVRSVTNISMRLVLSGAASGKRQAAGGLVGHASECIRLLTLAARRLPHANGRVAVPTHIFETAVGASRDRNGC
jgi:hypothetical protein